MARKRILPIAHKGYALPAMRRAGSRNTADRVAKRRTCRMRSACHRPGADTLTTCQSAERGSCGLAGAAPYAKPRGSAGSPRLCAQSLSTDTDSRKRANRQHSIRKHIKPYPRP